MGIGRGRGKFALEEVRAGRGGEGPEVKEGWGERIYSGRDKTLRNSFRMMTIDDLTPFHPSPSTLQLTFLTPTRLKFDGSLVPKLEFHILIRNLLRRISLLSYFHCGKELDVDFKGLIEEAQSIRVERESLSWFDWQRYSNRQDTSMKMGGFIGAITFEGDFEAFMPLLLIGEQTHVGKGTSFGLGKCNVRRGEAKPSQAL